jgi:hypothetical protein
MVRYNQREIAQLWKFTALPGGSAPEKARQAAAMEGSRGDGARRKALHRLLWNSRAGATAQWRGIHQSLHFAPACPVQRVASNGMSLAEFQHVLDHYLVWCNKRR